MSLRRRLLLATVAAMLVALAVVDVATYLTVSRAQLTQLDDSLNRAQQPVALLAASPQDWRAIPAVAPGLFVSIVDARGDELFTIGGGLPGDAGTDGDTSGGDDHIDLSSIAGDARFQSGTSVRGDELRVRIDPLDNGTVVLVGQSLADVNETTSTLLSVLAVATLAAIAIAAALAWWLVRAGLAPLRRVEESAAKIGEAGLGDDRVPGAGDSTEVGRLATTLNAMLDRLDRSRVERERSILELQESEARSRRFVADASHELRTPVAATAAYAELFEHGARDRPDDLERSMRGIRNETRRMTGLVNDLLLLARLDESRSAHATGDDNTRENGDPAGGDHEVDLVEVVVESIDAARTLEPERVIRPTINEVVVVEGNRLRLRQVVDNLLANVRAHCPVGATCEITLDVVDGAARLVVGDTGPGVPGDDLPRLFDRFSRVDTARSRDSGGNGLGLSIVDAIVRTHGGTIRAAANHPTGLVMTVMLPVSRRDAPAAETTGAS